MSTLVEFLVGGTLTAFGEVAVETVPDCGQEVKLGGVAHRVASRRWTNRPSDPAADKHPDWWKGRCCTITLAKT